MPKTQSSPRRGDTASKLNRNLEQRPDNRPMLSNLRNAGDIEDVADEVVLVYRDDVYEVSGCAPEKRTSS